VAAALFAFCFAPAAIGQTRPAAGGRSAPVRVQPFRGQYCRSLGPPGWAVIAENPQRVAFGADLVSADGLAYAGYSIFSTGQMSVQGFETPDRGVATQLTSFGSIRTRFGNRQQIGRNVFLVEYQTPANHGVAFYQVIPAGSAGYMVVMRTAGTGTGPGLWERRGPEAMAVARSLRCQVPNVPPAPEPPALNAKRSSGRSGGDVEESNTLYNRWLDMEYYHNSATGENFWVSPSHDYSRDGPDGPGYYAKHGNAIVKLDPGYAQ
jgi:hypothetical protein